MNTSRINKVNKILRNRRKEVFLHKIIIAASSFILLSILSIIILGFSSSAENNVPEYKYMKLVTVGYDDTLSQIAIDNYNDQNNMHYASIDKYIEDIACINHIEPDHINAGSIIIVPYYSTEKL